jgi:hypothetical protein
MRSCVRAIVAVGVAAIAVMTGQPARAEPPAAEGFTKAAAAHPMPAPKPAGKRSLQTLRERTAPVRRPARVETIALSAFPAVELTPLVTEPPKELAGPATDDLLIHRGRVSVKNHTFGLFELGWVSAAVVPQSGNGLSSWHFHGGAQFVRAQWVTLERASGGAIELEWAHAWFSERLGKAFVERKVKTRVLSLAGGLAHGFRTRCAACAPAERDVLRIVGPGGDWGTVPIRMSDIPLAAGHGRALVERVEPGAIRRMQPLMPSLDASRPVVMGLEVTQALGEHEPTILLHLADAPERRF